MSTVTIPKEEYEELKKKAEVDWELVEKIKRSLEDIKQGRIREWKPK
jgi:PHD/YefM family antitoxin component YafN of YafNO toxin-antitoxin module